MANYFKDRVVQFPGRVTLTPVSGQPNTYDMARAEGTVTEEGTPFNADTFNDIANTIHAFGTCTSSAISATKVVTCPGFVLHEGAKITVLFTNTNTGNSTLMNVNGTGARRIVRSIDPDEGNTGRLWANGEAVDFVYDGTVWVMVNPALTSGEMRALESRLEPVLYSTTRLYAILSAIIDKTVANKAGTRVILSSYTGGSIYTFPSDGYLTVRATAASNAEAWASIMDADGNAIGDIGSAAGTTYPAFTVFVKKGMKVTVTRINSNGSVHFTPMGA